MRSDVDGVHVAGVGVSDERIEGAGGRQPINDGGNRISVRSVIPRVGLTWEDDGFRDTYPLEGV
jgi:hypothetical protein